MFSASLNEADMTQLKESICRTLENRNILTIVRSRRKIEHGPYSTLPTLSLKEMG